MLSSGFVVIEMSSPSPAAAFFLEGVWLPPIHTTLLVYTAISTHTTINTLTLSVLEARAYVPTHQTPTRHSPFLPQSATPCPQQRHSNQHMPFLS
jgi:uncharacterized membrane protein